MQGITLIEVMIAMAILSIVSVSSFVVIQTQTERAYDGRRKSDLHNIKINLENYFDVADEYPAELPECNAPLMHGNQIVMAQVPCDPITLEKYFYKIIKDDNQAYRLYTLLANEDDLSVEYVGCKGGCGPNCEYNYGVSSPNIGLEKCSYVCAPGGGQLGSCERYEDPVLSQCPVLYEGDPTCRNECGTPKNRCKNASGKNKPD